VSLALFGNIPYHKCMGSLFLVATPIGNLDDVSIRVIHTLFSSDYIACEDTRTAGILLAELKKRFPFALPTEIKTPQFISYHDHTEEQTVPLIIEKIMEHDAQVSLISDAGNPLIADPGFRLMQIIIEKHIPCTVIPGPSAGITALVGSGLPTDQYLFLGYLPEKQGKRMKLLQDMSQLGGSIHPTCVCYVAPHKLTTTLTEIDDVFGTRELVLARELTKIHEEWWHGTANDALLYFKSPKGEMVLLISPQGKQ